ncbi:hypothetical protein NKT34_23035 [Paenibacillus polysaccharolyticus]|uniref:hypothetical protein n=1 Tax=Paenibacillus polysaccharolyticus TaxID=582692 RepID=UPI0020A0F1C7|nr:hypothetical protein [Paenibacillus polysaccharolyticus]MCP1136177.1 hypothetical protein [Paenibacillus polysaccharolyticus]
MKVRELVEIINTFGVPVNYFEQEKLHAIINYNSDVPFPIYFSVFSEEEKKKYAASKDKSKFESSTASIHFPDITLAQLVNLFECDGTGIHEFTLNRISHYLDKDIPRDVVYVTFLFLHEVGHWMQFISMNKIAEVYFNEDLELYQESHKKMQDFRIKRDTRINKERNIMLSGNHKELYSRASGRDELTLLTFRERKLVETLQKEYRNIPKEKDADTFAIENLEFALFLYKIN